MEKRSFNWLKTVLFGCAASIFVACNDSDEPMGKGEVEFEITDSPSDDANIKSVMVTVAEVKVDGKSIPGFTRQTIDLKAYQEGNTKVLGSTQLDAKTYNNITLVLDLDKDANGTAPGCYVLTKDNLKFKLKSTASGMSDIVISKSWKVANNAKTSVVLDFDLRKSIRYSEDPAIRYSFVSDNSLKAAVRVITREKSGTINGTYQDGSSNADKIIVYVYKKDSFDGAAEIQPSEDDGIRFKNAVASAEVKSTLTGKTYTVAFLEEGDYEVHFMAYTKDPLTGRYNFSARLKSETSVNGSAGNLIKIQGGATVNVSSSITGII